MGVLSDSELADCSDNGDDAIYVCAVARRSLRGILKGKQNPPVTKPVKCLDFHDKPYVREYVATGLILSPGGLIFLNLTGATDEVAKTP